MTKAKAKAKAMVGLILEHTTGQMDKFAVEGEIER